MLQSVLQACLSQQKFVTLSVCLFSEAAAVLIVNKMNILLWELHVNKCRDFLVQILRTFHLL